MTDFWDWNSRFVTDWQEVAPEFSETVSPSDSDRAVEQWEEEFMFESEQEYENVTPEQYWARYGDPAQDLCHTDVRTMSRDEFDRL